MTEKAGVAAPNWSTCATWFDYDNDGKLDLFVSSFVHYSADAGIFCGDNRLGATTASRASSSRDRASCFTTTATASFTT